MFFTYALFFEIAFVSNIRMQACTYVYASSPEAINNQWHDMYSMWLDKQVLQLLCIWQL